MIDGVKVKQLTMRHDIPDVAQPAVQPGFLLEIVRDDDDLLQKFGQTTYTVAYKGTIKAFHWHLKQDDLWFVATGEAKIVLYDRRNNSPTKGEIQVIYAGEQNRVLVLIPAGVIHGYKVISDEPVALFYHTTESYNREHPDEERTPYDDPVIGFDWTKD